MVADFLFFLPHLTKYFFHFYALEEASLSLSIEFYVHQQLDDAFALQKIHIKLSHCEDGM